MKIKISLVSLLLAFVMFSFAQEVKTYSDVAGVKTAFVPNKTWNNWFIQLGGGAQMFLGENFKTDAIGDAISFPALNFSIGRWWSPYWGFRFKVQDVGMFVGEFKDFANDTEIKGINGHLDAMWNMSQYFGRYNAKRVFNFIPYAGLGAYWRDALDPETVTFGRVGWYGKAQKGITVDAGLLLEFRLGNHVNFHVDLAGTLLTDDYLNGIIGGTRYEGIASATAGFTFNLGKSYFEVLQPMDQDLINDLNSKINDLRLQNDELSKRPVKCDPCPEVVAPSPVVPESNYVSTISNVVLFRINSAVVDANQQVSIYNTAQFVKNSGEKVKVVGYADKKTGTAARNLKLSELRAKAVAKELTSKYGIPSDKIVVEWKGANEQPFAENVWNRVVIMSAQ